MTQATLAPANLGSRRHSSRWAELFDQGRASDLRHRSRAHQRQSRRRVARRRPVRGDQIAPAQAQGVVPERPGHHPGRARRLRAALRPARGPPGGGQRSGKSGPGSDPQGSGHARGAVRERLSLRHDVARVPAVRGRASVYRGARRGRRHDLGQHGAGLRAPARAHQGADRGPARPAQHRGHLRGRHADREAARPEGAVSRTPSTRWCAPTRRPARRCCSSTPSPRTSPTSTPRRTCASGRTIAPGASQLLNYLISQAYVPEYQVRWRLRKNSVAIWDNRCTQHYAVQDFWPAVRNLERAGIIGDRPV